MPDPLTALGAAAAASQFVAQGLKITIYLYQAFQKIKDSPENIRKALAEVEQLISISKLIIQNESLQTESIASTLGICLRDITKLESILRKVSPGEDASKSEKFRKAVVATFKEDAITKLLASLDREKMNLSLCMHEINSSLLGSIGIRLQGAHTTAGELLLVVNDSARNVQTVVDVLPGIAEQVTTIHETFPDMSTKLSMISTDSLPAIISLIQAKHEEMMSVLVGSSKTAGYFNVPNRLSRNFVGREDVLQRLHQLCRQDRQSSITIVLRALGGQGKSQAAMKFCQETRGSPFRSTFWIDASSELSINKSILNFYLQTRASSSEKLDSAEAIATYVRDHFERMTEPWLIVFDNLDEPEDIPVVRDLIPASKLGIVLISSRHADALFLADSGCTIELEALSDLSASELLVRAASLDPTSSSLEQALIISKKLSKHPLAIAQAGSYISRKRLLLSEFIHQYERHLQLVLAQNHLPLSEYQRKLNDEEKATSLSVFATWELSLAQLEQEKTGPKMFKEDLLNLLGFSYSIEVPEDIFAVFCANIQPWDSTEIMKKNPGSYLAEQLGNWNSTTYVEVLAEFLDLSLIQGYNRREDGFYQASVHPLVKDWIMLRIPEDRSAEYRILMMEILTEAMNPTDGRPDIVPTVLEFHPIAAEMGLDKVPEDHEDPRGSSDYSQKCLKRPLRVQNAFLETMLRSGRMHEVERVGWHLVPLNNKIFGAVSMESVTLGMYIAEALCHLDKPSQAEKLLRKILQHTTALHGMENAECHILKILSIALHDRGNHEEALAMIDQAIKLQTRMLGPSSVNVLDSTIDLALGLNRQGKHQESVSKCLQVQAMVATLPLLDTYEFQKIRGKCAYALGYIYQSAGRWSDAVEEMEMALQYHLKTHGEIHVDTSSCFMYLALSLARLGRLEEAERHHRKADKVLSAALGTANSNTLFSTFSLAWCLWKQGKLLQGEECYRRAYEGILILKGDDYKITKQLVSCLALVLRDKGLDDACGHLIRHHYKQLVHEQVYTEEEIEKIVQETLSKGVDDF